ncbi:YbhB/YbcL family Raf kinase inhibitor-like protein [Cryobacterium tepidiphilum]|uniref:YbhB/YbcL family Raf kinase inhibitor-like protein n=1 Tax=Cryobacterium tepidiphilum TaxID=2486026 RepID=A0A3M8LNB7_9MICO|nr:YbhB/YbcL family Raf kinase inhibitor-like protein [Cryobacterium tepidiphilum]RNE67016.1 YbhB/YbcL family Raf kinase inhibitor-like protein [Cryobacterium tepidiphilum]
MSADPLARFGEVPQFTVTSEDMTDGAPLAAAQFDASSGGGNTSPQLSWSGFPPETKSFAVTAYDPDAPTGSGFWHWAVFNLPASCTSLPAGAGEQGGAGLPDGAVMLPNELRQPAFTGAAPPEGTGTHRYQFIVHAVDGPSLDIDSQATPAVLGFNLHFHVLARAVLEATGAFGGATG